MNALKREPAVAVPDKDATECTGAMDDIPQEASTLELVESFSNICY